MTQTDEAAAAAGDKPAKNRRGSSAAGSARDPERTRAAILDAAVREFATEGFGGARVDAIAARAKINKRMLYHYFGNKGDLYLAVLEETYRGIRVAERKLHLEDLPPDEGMRRLVTFTWEYFLEHPEFLSLLNTENMMRARHLKRSKRIQELHSPLIGLIDELLTRGAREGLFRSGVDPVQLYVTIASIGFFYLSNRWTLSTIFGRDLNADAALKERGAHIVDVVLGYLKP
ncbi:TetR/AcrR family transcriptional regulator [Allomesorhizobium camelthorni]|uniref:TetR/AcrR family transcriptional regulator n=1 Tax=Allomesorhizobium camelthorni TaxID=475069 RepID=A0A6G4WEP2_9HYPH|nr:TetR/AcrR family transcriptional regulator [Mesorhizobium camelthorni]NGO52696.1 TetR/AcrR family transcriptional regulator [Mesorhizobium camelthorni]